MVSFRGRPCEAAMCGTLKMPPGRRIAQSPCGLSAALQPTLRFWCRPRLATGRRAYLQPSVGGAGGHGALRRRSLGMNFQFAPMAIIAVRRGRPKSGHSACLQNSRFMCHTRMTLPLPNCLNVWRQTAVTPYDIVHLVKPFSAPFTEPFSKSLGQDHHRAQSAWEAWLPTALQAHLW